MGWELRFKTRCHLKIKKQKVDPPFLGDGEMKWLRKRVRLGIEKQGKG